MNEEVEWQQTRIRPTWREKMEERLKARNCRERKDFYSSLERNKKEGLSIYLASKGINTAFRVKENE
jgi:hypothetical protein